MTMIDADETSPTTATAATRTISTESRCLKLKIQSIASTIGLKQAQKKQAEEAKAALLAQQTQTVAFFHQQQEQMNTKSKNPATGSKATRSTRGNQASTSAAQ